MARIVSILTAIILYLAVFNLLPAITAAAPLLKVKGDHNILTQLIAI